MRIVTTSSIFITLLIGASATADAQDKRAIEKKLAATYNLTQATADNTDIVTAGSILVLQSSSHLCMGPAYQAAFQSTYKEGKITADKKNVLKGGNIGLVGIRLGAQACLGGREYVKGEKMWVTKIEVKDDGVYFDLFTDPVNDVRYKATLKFQVHKNIALTPDQAVKLIAEVFTTQPLEELAPTQDNPPPPPSRVQGGAPPPPAVAPPPPIEAPPPPIDAPPPPREEPKVIKLGEPKAQVIADFGQPVRIAQAAAGKEIYFYKDIKVTFTAGKVTNLE